MKKTFTFLSLLLGASANYGDTLNGDSNVTGDFDIQDNLTVGGDATIDGVLTVNGATVWNDSNTENIIRDNDYINPLNFNGGLNTFNTLITNWLYQMDKRGTVTTSGFTDDTKAPSYLFNSYPYENYEFTRIAPNQTATVEISFPSRITYGVGYIVVSTSHQRHADSVKVEIMQDLNNDGIAETPYLEIAESLDAPMNNNAMRYHVFPVLHSSDTTYLIGLKVTVVGASDNYNNFETAVSEIEYHRPRPNQNHFDHFPIVTKYGPQTLIHDLTFNDSTKTESIKFEAEKGKITARELDVEGYNSFNFANYSNNAYTSIDVGGEAFIQVNHGSSYQQDEGNIAIGYGGDLSTATGKNNVSLGNYALESTLATSDNIAIGLRSMQFAETGSHNIGIGQSALANYSGLYSIGIGYNALSRATGSSTLTAIGRNAMQYSGSGFLPGTTTVGLTPDSVLASIAIGAEALQYLNSGQDNLAVGHDALTVLTDGGSNVGIGPRSGRQIETGTMNTFVGPWAANTQTEGNRNIAIGNYANLPNSSGDDQLNIGNTIYGDLANDKIGIGVAQPEKNLHVAGDTKLDGDVEVTGNIVLAGPAGDISMGIFGESQ